MVIAKQSLSRMDTFQIFLLVSMGPIVLRGHVEFNNVHCLVRDRKFMDFEYCYLKSVNRSYKYLSLKTKFFQLPIETCVTKFQLRMRDNKRILYNFDIKVDACKFLRDPDKHVLANWVYQTFAPFSNMNHTCPYTVTRRRDRQVTSASREQAGPDDHPRWQILHEHHLGN
nr:uncharacterized protein LOC108008220 isoform X2 [Drosophila suzukii]